MAGNIHRIEVNPLIAARSGDAQNQGSKGTGQPPVIRNLSEIDQSDGPARRIIGLEDGATNYVMAFRGLDPGSNAHKHALAGEHLGFVLEGTVILAVDGVGYTVCQGDVAPVPPRLEDEWCSNSDKKANWLVFNPR